VVNAVITDVEIVLGILRKMTKEKIYKLWKHGGSLHDIPINKIHDALKQNGIQVIIVNDSKANKHLYYYHPDTKVFYKIQTEQKFVQTYFIS